MQKLWEKNSSSANLTFNLRFTRPCTVLRCAVVFPIFCYLPCFLCIFSSSLTLSICFLNNFPHYFGMKEHIFIQQWIEGSEGGGGVVGGRGAREVDFRLPLQFQERMQLIMIRDVPGKGQLKLQQA